jgi:hypothetical protein
MVGMAHSANPRVAPGQHPVGPNFRYQPGYLEARLAIRNDAGVRKTQEAGLDSEQISDPRRERISPRCDFIGWNGTVCIGGFAASEPCKYHAIAPCDLSGDRGDHSYLVVWVREGDKEGVPGIDRRRLRHHEAAARNSFRLAFRLRK